MGACSGTWPFPSKLQQRAESLNARCRRKESINLPEDQTNKFHKRERVKVWLDECLKHESDARSNEVSTS